MKLHPAQQKAINSILSEYYKGTKIIDFKAPTGSGKTFMAASIISRLIVENINDKMVFVIATLSSANLPKQFESKLQEYQNYLETKYEVEFIDSPSNKDNKLKDHYRYINVTRNKVYLFGKSSFGKGRLLTEEGIFESFLDEIQNNGYKLIYIRDEAHIGIDDEGKNEKSAKINEEAQLTRLATFTIRMTATPKIGNKQIIINENELEYDGKSLLKSEPIFNEDADDGKGIILDDPDLLRSALYKFKKIKMEYSQEFVKGNIPKINPALLIQVSSISDELKSKEEFDKYINQLKIIIEDEGLQWATYFSGQDQKLTSTQEEANLHKISHPLSSIDVIIFKVGPATGWDIPRACMLLQLRKVYSSSLNQQTLGRIKRNPVEGLWINEVTNKYYVYSNYQEKTRDLFQYELKEKWLYEKVPVIKAKINTKIENENMDKLKSEIDKYMIEKSIEINQKIIERFEGSPKKVHFEETKFFDTTNNKQITKYERTVYNALELKLEILRFVRDNYDWKDCEKSFCEYFEINLKKNKRLSFVNISHFHFIIIKYFWHEIQDRINTFRDKNVHYDYLIKNDANFKKNYLIWANNMSSKNNVEKEAKLNLVDFETIEKNYLYLNTNKDFTYKQAMDSNPEHYFMKAVVKYITKTKPSFHFFVKNPSLGNEVFLEYKGESGRKAKAFIDFIYATDEGWVYIEVKGHNDYDKLKTNRISDAFIEYNKIENKMIRKMKFAIVKIDTDKDNEKDFKFDFFCSTFGGEASAPYYEKSIEEFFNEIKL